MEASGYSKSVVSFGQGCGKGFGEKFTSAGTQYLRGLYLHGERGGGIIPAPCFNRQVPGSVANPYPEHLQVHPVRETATCTTRSMRRAARAEMCGFPFQQ